MLIPGTKSQTLNLFQYHHFHPKIWEWLCSFYSGELRARDGKELALSPTKSLVDLELKPKSLALFILHLQCGRVWPSFHGSSPSQEQWAGPASTSDSMYWFSSLSSLQHSSLCFSSVLFPHSLLLHHLGYCVSFHDYPLEQKKKQLWKKENSLRSHFLKRNSNLFFPGELTTKKEAWVHLFAKLQVSVVLLLTDYVEATCKLEKWTFPCWVKLCLSPSIIIIDRFRLKRLWNALSF